MSAFVGGESSRSHYATRSKRAKLNQPSSATSTRAVGASTNEAASSPATSAPTTSAASDVMTTTAAQIRDAINALDMARVLAHFNRDGDHVADDDDDDFEDIEPFLVCDGVSVDAFNEYDATEEEEGLRIPMRCLELDADGRLLIVEYPISTVHESTTFWFGFDFVQAIGNRNAVAARGSMTAMQIGRPNKEADATFGPSRRVPHRLPPPPPRTLDNWVTVAVEVGRSQSWQSLLDAAEWWINYVGVEYILLLKVSRRGRKLRYALYDAAVPGVPGVPAAPGRRTLPPPTAAATIYHRPVTGGPAFNVTFDMHRVLAVPAPHPLPAGVNPQAVVDLRQVMENVIGSVD